MDRIRAFIQQNRRVVLIAAIGVAVILGFWVGTRLLGGGPTVVTPTPQPAATPAPGTAPTPAPAPPAAPSTPAPAPSGVVPSTPTGRPDPFVPVVSETPAGAPVRPGASAPPSTPLPPPPFPVPPPPSAQPAPGAPGTPGAAPPPPPEAGVQVLGIISDAKSVVIVSVGGKTDILFEGESIGDLKVIKINAIKGIVTFERNGKRFDLKIGGG